MISAFVFLQIAYILGMCRGQFFYRVPGTEYYGGFFAIPSIYSYYYCMRRMG